MYNNTYSSFLRVFYIFFSEELFERGIIMDMDGIVKMVYPDGSDSGDEITVRCLCNIIRRAKIGFYVESFALPVLIGGTIITIIINKNKIQKVLKHSKKICHKEGEES